MSISRAYFRPHGPPTLKILQNQLPECWRAFDEHQLGMFPATCPPRFQSAGAHLTRQEGSIMSISWAYFRPHGPTRFQMLQNQLPECWRAFDEAGGEHHEHQLGIFPATWPP